jgi:hypothetical protein
MPSKWTRALTRWFAGAVVNESVVTRMYLDASPETAWNEMMFYEQVPGRAPLLLRAFVPCPVRTEGSKSSVGATVRCIYKGGDLVKRMTVIDPPRIIKFEVLEQRLGIEVCAIARTGSYELEASRAGTNIFLTTNYSAYLHPRWFWRPLEKLVTSQLHHHVLRGMRAAVQPEAVAVAASGRDAAAAKAR